MKKLTIKTAYELAVKKWQYIVDNNGSEEGLLQAIPELSDFNAYCSYCEMFVKNPIWCKGCPLDIISHSYLEHSCLSREHPYNIWDSDPTKETAQAVLDLIIKTKPL